MIEKKRIVKYDGFHNTIQFPTKINSYIIADFSSAVTQFKKRRPDDTLTLSFSNVQTPYCNGMLPIIATVSNLRKQGHKIKIIHPEDQSASKLFKTTNWAHYLNPEVKRSDSKYDRHLTANQFTDYTELKDILNDFMDVILGSMSVPKDIITALEWSINEICDNVINHSESQVGGFVELVTFAKKGLVSFTVADAGRGILNSLKEGIPSLRTDVQAIGEAIKAGVTRNKEHGQGNGLAGSLRVTTMTGGSIDIISGACRFYSTGNDNQSREADRNQSFLGTSVSGQIQMNKSFSVQEALDFGGPLPYVPINIIDLNYEMEDKDCLQIIMKKETTGFGTRYSGAQAKTKILNLVEAKQGYPIFIDWNGIPVISSSFADEFMGKLFLDLGPLNFSYLIRNINMEPLIRQLLDKAIFQRVSQGRN